MTESKDWRVEFDKIEYNGIGGFDKIKSFIEKLLQAEREIMSDAIEMSKMGWIDQGRIEERKKLIKELIEEVKSLQHWGIEKTEAERERKHITNAIISKLDSHIRDTK